MLTPRLAALVAIAPLAACLADSVKGDRDAGELPDAPDLTDGVGDSAADAEPADTLDTTPDATAPDTAPDTAGPVCGDHVVQSGEACDDGNTCAGDGCGRCRSEPTLVLTRLELRAELGFDLDDRDGDGDLHTGIDNRLASSEPVRATLNRYIAASIAAGEVIQLATLVLDDPGDASVSLILHAGRDPACLTTGPFPWLEGPGAELFASLFPGCAPPVALDASVADGHLIADALHLALPLGSLGTFDITRARLEADLVSDDTSVSTLEGTLGGVLPASVLFRIDTSALLPLCPTALHAVLGLAGHLDQDGGGDGKVDFIRWTTTPNTMPCVSGPVVISGCCVDGDCEAGLVEGHNCPLDPRIDDGYSIGFSARAHAVHISDATDQVCAP